jgi:hypothetical protein
MTVSHACAVAAYAKKDANAVLTVSNAALRNPVSAALCVAHKRAPEDSDTNCQGLENIVTANNEAD